MKRGVSAESPSASRSRFIAALMLCSKSTIVSPGQSCLRRSSRVTSSPGRSTSMPEDPQRLPFELDLHPAAAQLQGAPVEFEGVEPKEMRSRVVRGQPRAQVPPCQGRA